MGLEASAPARGSSCWSWLACWIALAATLAVVEPFWEINDDVAMAMIVHGYGIAAAPDPSTVFQNVIYGRLVQALPDLFGIQAYGLACYGLLILACGACCFALHRASAPTALAAPAVFAAFAPALVYPQFTLLAGLLAVSGLLVLLGPASRLSAFESVLGGTLLVLAALVRLDEVLLIGAIAWPFLLGISRPARARSFAAIACAVLLIAVCAAMNRAHYEAEAWREFQAVNKQRVRFTDYGYSRYFLKHPLDAVLAGFTFNDLRLLETFFFADPRLFSVERFERATRDVNPLFWVLSNLSTAGELVRPFTHPQFLALASLLALIAWRFPARSVRWSVALLAAAMVLGVLVGRPGVTRVVVPPLAGILFLGLANAPAGRALPRWTAGAALIVAAALVIALTVRNIDDRAEAVRTRAALCALPSDRLYVAWGDTVPLERIYTPLSPPAAGCPLRLYGIGVYTYAPFALERLHGATGGRDLVAALLGGQELDFLAPDGLIEGGLEIYMRQHYGAKLVTRRLAQHGTYSWHRVSTVQR